MSDRRYKLDETIAFSVTRGDANFDRACDAARLMANIEFDVDDCGHINDVENSCRSTDTICVMFRSYMLYGCEHTYRFEAVVRRSEPLSDEMDDGNPTEPITAFPDEDHDENDMEV